MTGWKTDGLQCEYVKKVHHAPGRGWESMQIHPTGHASYRIHHSRNMTKITCSAMMF
jgi:hypothetical protein